MVTRFCVDALERLKISRHSVLDFPFRAPTSGLVDSGMPAIHFQGHGRECRTCYRGAIDCGITVRNKARGQVTYCSNDRYGSLRTRSIRDGAGRVPLKRVRENSRTRFMRS